MEVPHSHFPHPSLQMEQLHMPAHMSVLIPLCYLMLSDITRTAYTFEASQPLSPPPHTPSPCNLIHFAFSF